MVSVGYIYFHLSVFLWVIRVCVHFFYHLKILIFENIMIMFRQFQLHCAILLNQDAGMLRFPETSK